MIIIDSLTTEKKITYKFDIVVSDYKSIRVNLEINDINKSYKKIREFTVVFFDAKDIKAKRYKRYHNDRPFEKFCKDYIEMKKQTDKIKFTNNIIDGFYNNELQLLEDYIKNEYELEMKYAEIKKRNLEELVGREEEIKKLRKMCLKTKYRANFNGTDTWIRFHLITGDEKTAYYISAKIKYRTPNRTYKKWRPFHKDRFNHDIYFSGRHRDINEVLSEVKEYLKDDSKKLIDKTIKEFKELVGYSKEYY